MAEMVAEETRKQYEKHKQHVGTHGGNDAAASLVLADAVIVSANKVVDAIDTLSALYRERSELEERQALGEDRYNIRKQVEAEAREEKADAKRI